MQYAQLRAFHAVAEHGGFSRAAEALHLTQPAISDQVRRLEQEFGVTLFYRRARTVEPTPLGRRLFNVTRQFFAFERDARDILTSAGTLISGSLTLAADAPDLAVKLIAAFRERYPGILVNLMIANAQECMERVLNYEADAAVTAALLVDGRLVSQVLRREPIVAIVPRGHTWVGRASVTLAEFAGQPVIFRESRSVTQRLLEEDLTRHGLQVDPAMLVEGRGALEEAVASALGIGVITRAEFNGDPRIVPIPLADSQAEMVEALVRLGDRPPSRLLTALFDTSRAPA
jgi:aminoethylphosphonate catabolism LysR family transcriptional regulator